jgi:tetratricopeptide (TPR) repeat protein
MSASDVRDLIDEATFEYTLGDHAAALEKLGTALELDPQSFDAWLAKAEVCFDQRALDDALAAGEAALALRPEDVHAHTTLSRIWMERGDKEKAEHHGAQARMMGWKAELKGTAGEDDED